MIYCIMWYDEVLYMGPALFNNRHTVLLKAPVSKSYFQALIISSDIVFTYYIQYS